MITGLNFQPWISENYKDGKDKYGRLLLLGESHYIKEDENEKDKDAVDSSNNEQHETSQENNFTSGVVQDFLDKKHNISFFRNLGLLFNPDDKFALWNEVAFANGIQVGLSSSTAQPTQAEIETVKKAFWLLIDTLEPDKILVCSKRMWNYWVPEDSDRSRFIRNIEANGKHSTIWEYQLANRKSLAMGINHPSKYFSYENWRPLVNVFLSLQ